MNNWSKTPIVRIIIPFAMGIIFYRFSFFKEYFNIVFLITIVLIMLISVWLLLFKSISNLKINFLQNFLLLFCVFNIAWLLSYSSDFRNKSDYIGNFDTKTQVILLLKATDDVEQKNNNIKTLASAIAYKSDDGWVPCSGKILMYFENKDSLTNLKYGDVFAAKTFINSVQKPLFNSDFDYKKYLENKNIFHQCYVPEGNYTILKRNQGNPLLSLALKVRKNIIDILHKNIGNTDESGVLSAMLTGYRADISADMMKAYNGAGVIHIMSVSGLHVGVIYIMITAFIGLFGWFKKKLYLGVIIVLVAIWFYALVTGLSASVIRASLMISFVALGSVFNRSISSINSLAAAALVLLIINPNNIGEIGFQLSCSAVLGILLFQKPIYKLIYVKNKWLDKIWQLACVSIAAQLITLPFILYYFGQFPIYFIISNILVVPLSGIVLYAGISSVLLAWVPYLNKILTFITILLTKTMNLIVLFIESLPGAILGNIYLSAWTSILLFTIIASTYLMFKQKKLKILYFTFFFCIIATLFEWNYRNENKNLKSAFLIKDGKEFVCCIKQEKSLYIIIPQDFQKISSYLKTRIQRFAERNNLNTWIVGKTYNDGFVFRKNNFLAWKTHTFLNWKNHKLPDNPELLPHIDIMLASSLSRYYLNKYDGKNIANLLLTQFENKGSNNKYVKIERENAFIFN